MADFIRRRESRTVHHCSAFFPVWSPAWGFEFETDADGNIREPEFPEARESLRQCLAGVLDDGTPVGAREDKHWTSREVTPAIVRCSCGAEHELDDQNGMGDSQCPKCGQWRNACGQCLVDPENWGEETGETFDSSGHYVHGDFHDYGPEGA